MDGRSGGLPGIGEAFSVRYGIFVFPKEQEVNLIPVGDETLLSKKYVFNCIVLEQFFFINVRSVDNKSRCDNSQRKTTHRGIDSVR